MIDDNVPPEDQSLFDALAELPKPEPPPSSLALFRAAAQQARRIRPSRRVPLVIGIAAALVVAVGAGWWIDRGREEVAIASLQSQLALALNDQSAAVRIHAIAAMSSSPATDSRILIVAALTTSLLSDSSTNVRVAAAEALGRVADPTALRDAAQQSLPRESSPFVQAALLTAAARLSAPDRAAIVTALLSHANVDPIIRAEADRLTRS